ncbi:hypothetical protein WDW37_19715 [Bdellovibrionota bacterium FG-1]
MKNPGIQWLNGVIILLVASEVASAAPPVPSPVPSCTSTREYITTLEYLRDRQEVAMPELDAQKTALEASKGCNGAARRFIRVSHLLSRAGLGPRDAVHKGLEFAKRTDQETETFTSVFRQAFAEDAMDLDLRASMKMAEELTGEFDGDTVAVLHDFEKLLDFCSDSGKLGLPKPQCGAFAAHLAKQGQKWNGGISVPYIQAFEFAVSEKGPGLPTSKAIEIANKLVTAGPDSADNFISAYRYAISKKGLDLANHAALAFALQMGLAKEDVPTPPSK